MTLFEVKSSIIDNFQSDGETNSETINDFSQCSDNGRGKVNQKEIRESILKPNLKTEVPVTINNFHPSFKLTNEDINEINANDESEKEDDSKFEITKKTTIRKIISKTTSINGVEKENEVQEFLIKDSQINDASFDSMKKEDSGRFSSSRRGSHTPIKKQSVGHKNNKNINSDREYQDSEQCNSLKSDLERINDDCEENKICQVHSNRDLCLIPSDDEESIGKSCEIGIISDEKSKLSKLSYFLNKNEEFQRSSVCDKKNDFGNSKKSQNVLNYDENNSKKIDIENLSLKNDNGSLRKPIYDEKFDTDIDNSSFGGINISYSDRRRKSKDIGFSPQTMSSRKLYWTSSDDGFDREVNISDKGVINMFYEKDKSHSKDLNLLMDTNNEEKTSKNRYICDKSIHDDKKPKIKDYKYSTHENLPHASGQLSSNYGVDPDADVDEKCEIRVNNISSKTIKNEFSYSPENGSYQVVDDNSLNEKVPKSIEVNSTDQRKIYYEDKKSIFKKKSDSSELNNDRKSSRKIVDEKSRIRISDGGNKSRQKNSAESQRSYKYSGAANVPYDNIKIKNVYNEEDTHSRKLKNNHGISFEKLGIKTIAYENSLENQFINKQFESKGNGMAYHSSQDKDYEIRPIDTNVINMKWVDPLKMNHLKYDLKKKDTIPRVTTEIESKPVKNEKGNQKYQSITPFTKDYNNRTGINTKSQAPTNGEIREYIIHENKKENLFGARHPQTTLLKSSFNRRTSPRRKDFQSRNDIKKITPNNIKSIKPSTMVKYDNTVLRRFNSLGDINTKESSVNKEDRPSSQASKVLDKLDDLEKQLSQSTHSIQHNCPQYIHHFCDDCYYTHCCGRNYCEGVPEPYYSVRSNFSSKEKIYDIPKQISKTRYGDSLKKLTNSTESPWISSETTSHSILDKRIYNLQKRLHTLKKDLKDFKTSEETSAKESEVIVRSQCRNIERQLQLLHDSIYQIRGVS